MSYRKSVQVRDLWRWWRWENRYGRSKPLHSRPHIGRRRARRVLYSNVLGEGDVCSFYQLKSAAGRRLAFQRPPYELNVETVPSGPYEETYAGWRAAFWWQCKVMRSRERRGWNRKDAYKGLYRPHPLQGGRL